jgi:hypothetical protein
LRGPGQHGIGILTHVAAVESSVQEQPRENGEVTLLKARLCSCCGSAAATLRRKREESHQGYILSCPASRVWFPDSDLLSLGGDVLHARMRRLGVAQVWSCGLWPRRCV